MDEPTKASIVYNLTPEDMHLYCIKYSITPEYRRTLCIYSLWQACLYFVIAFLVNQGRMGYGNWEALWKSGLFAGLLSLCGYYNQKNKVFGQIAQLSKTYCDEIKNPGLLGEYTLEVNEGGFTLTSKYKHTRFDWEALTGIELEQGRTYLSLGSLSALPIPHDNIISGDLVTVLEQIKQHYHPHKELEALL